jgi:hypothetical protein
LRWLERAFWQSDPYLQDLKIERLWDPLRDTQRFQTLLRKIGFEDWHRLLGTPLTRQDSHFLENSISAPILENRVR